MNALESDIVIMNMCFNAINGIETLEKELILHMGYILHSYLQNQNVHHIKHIERDVDREYNNKWSIVLYT